MAGGMGLTVGGGGWQQSVVTGGGQVKGGLDVSDKIDDSLIVVPKFELGL
jgi:hypothetical protein